jgi:hypothetical protein
MAIAGYPKHYVFFPVTGIFRLTYTANNVRTNTDILFEISATTLCEVTPYYNLHDKISYCMSVAQKL